MPALEIGRVCLKTKGRKAGEKVVVLGTEKGFAIVEGANHKKKRCNPRHLFPTGEKLSVSKSTSSEEVKKLLK